MVLLAKEGQFLKIYIIITLTCQQILVFSTYLHQPVSLHRDPPGQASQVRQDGDDDDSRIAQVQQALVRPHDRDLGLQYEDGDDHTGT